MNTIRTTVTRAQSIPPASFSGSGSFAHSNTKRLPPLRSTANCPSRSRSKGCGLPATSSDTFAAARISVSLALSFLKHDFPSFRVATRSCSHSSFSFVDENTIFNRKKSVLLTDLVNKSYHK